MGVIYLRQNQGTMAKIHFNQALKLDPNDQNAIEGIKRLEQSSAGATGGKAAASKTPTGTKPASQKSSTKPQKPDDKQGGGGLFGLFGKKK
jgi:hypothetical protein